jgi:hypothetical protein
MIDNQTLFNIVVGVGLPSLGWFAREIWGAVKDLRNDLHKIEVALPEKYIKRDEFQEGLKEIKDICRQIFERLDNKVDKRG